MKKLDRQDFAKRPPESFVRSCLQVGFTQSEISRLGKSTHWRGGADYTSWNTGRGVASLMSHVHHVYRGMDMERSVGTIYYLAQTTTFEVGALFRSYDFLEERGRLQSVAYSGQ